VVIHLLRHAEAEEISATGRDADRPLTPAGAKRMRTVARAVARLEPGYDAILVSPLLRARQTAEPVARACRFRKALKESRNLAPMADPGAVLKELAELKASSVLLVGHQPHLGLLFGLLLTGRPGLEVPLKKASLAAFEAGADPRAGVAELRFHLSPRLLEELAPRR